MAASNTSCLHTIFNIISRIGRVAGRWTLLLLAGRVLAATNEAIRSAQDLANKKLGGAGIDIPGLPGMF